MKTSRKMKSVIEKLAQKHGVNVYKPGVHLKLEMECYMPLVIENIGADQISVTHYFEQCGDLVCDPDIVFLVVNGEWVPIEITQTFPGYQRVCELNDAGKIASYKPRAQASVATFANQWARNIENQGWLENGRRHVKTERLSHTCGYPVAVRHEWDSEKQAYVPTFYDGCPESATAAERIERCPKCEDNLVIDDLRMRQAA